MIFRNKKAPTVTSVPRVPLYPTPEQFYILEKEEWSGLLPPHSVKISFVLPYSDWCEFEKSNLFQSLENHLQELQKRDNLNENVNNQSFDTL